MVEMLSVGLRFSLFVLRLNFSGGSMGRRQACVGDDLDALCYRLFEKSHKTTLLKDSTVSTWDHHKLVYYSRHCNKQWS